LLEVAIRSFYARQDARTPLITAGINFVVFTVLSIVLSQFWGVAGISTADSLAFTSQAVLLFVLLNRQLVQRIIPGPALVRGLIAALVGGALVMALSVLPISASQPLLVGAAALALGGLAAMPVIWKELRLLLRL
jgi:putative peptidoglycan lipid II flippase